MTPVFLGKLIGLYLAAFSLAMVVNPRRAAAALQEMTLSGPWRLFSGVTASAVGLAIVLGSAGGSGGALSALVTLTGWAALMKGLALLLVPGERIAAASARAGLERHFRAGMAVGLTLGLTMACLAFSA